MSSDNVTFIGSSILSKITKNVKKQEMLTSCQRKQESTETKPKMLSSWKFPSAQISRQYLEGVWLSMAARHLCYILTDFFLQENDISV